jgi:hypothetical protein
MLNKKYEVHMAGAKNKSEVGQDFREKGERWKMDGIGPYRK